MAGNSRGDSSESSKDTSSNARERIWYRQSTSSEKTGPFPLDTASRWYANCAVLPSAEFSSDDGANWMTIVDLRRRNGISCPFLSLTKGYQASGSNSSELIDAEAEITRLEREVALMMNELKKDEERLQKMRIIEKDIEGNSEEEKEELGENEEHNNTDEEKEIVPEAASSDDQCADDKRARTFWEEARAKANEFHPASQEVNAATTQQVVGTPLYHMPLPPHFFHQPAHPMHPPPFIPHPFDGLLPSPPSFMPPPPNPLAMIPNPFAEMPGLRMDGRFLVDLVNRTSAVNVLRIDKRGCAYSINGVDPMSILEFVPAPPNLAVDMVTPYVIKLRELLNRIDRNHFKKLVNHLHLTKKEKPRCMACYSVESKVPILLLQHIVGDLHIEWMKARNVLFSMESLAYWMLTLRIAQKNAPWSHTFF